MCVCDWQLLAVTVALTLLIICYGEIESRRRSRASQLRTQRQPQLTAHGRTVQRPDEASAEPFRSHSGEIT